MKTDKPVLYYVHDPMCSWCWGFHPHLLQLEADLSSDISFRYLLGGLAADNSEPMPENMRQYLQQTWRNIQQRIPGTRFNFDFWSVCQPRRSTYPACRAVIAAKKQSVNSEKSMILAIQQAYYLEAKNPSDDTTLIALAGQLGLDTKKFTDDLNSVLTDQELQKQIQLARQLGADSFPSLILRHDNHNVRIVIDYNNVTTMLSQINEVLKSDVGNSAN